MRRPDFWARRCGQRPSNCYDITTPLAYAPQEFEVYAEQQVAELDDARRARSKLAVKVVFMEVVKELLVLVGLLL